MATATAFLLGVLIAQSAPVPLPDTGALSLNWTAPAVCLQRDQIAAEVRKLAGDPLRHQALIAVGRVTRESAGKWRAELRTRMGGIEGERVLQGGNCDDVSRAAALVLALMIKPTSERPSEAPVSEKQESVASVDASKSPPFQSADVADIQARVAVAAGVDTLPGLAAATELHGLVTWRLWSWELRGGLWFPTTAASEVLSGAGGRFWMLEASSMLCAHPWGFSPHLDTCVGGSLTRMAGRGFGVSDPGESSATFGSVVVEQAAAVSLMERLELRLALQGLWPTSRPRFDIEQLGTVHRPGRLGWRTVLAAQLDF